MTSTEPKVYNIYRAQPIGTEQPEVVQIVIEQNFPDLPGRGRLSDVLAEAAQVFDKEAQMLFEALQSLPGGTWDRLLGKMLEHKASHFVVGHGSRGVL